MFAYCMWCFWFSDIYFTLDCFGFNIRYCIWVLFCFCFCFFNVDFHYLHLLSFLYLDGVLPIPDNDNDDDVQDRREERHTENTI